MAEKQEEEDGIGVVWYFGKKALSLRQVELIIYDMMKNFFILLIFLGAARGVAMAQELPKVFGEEYEGRWFGDERKRVYIAPQRIVWTSGEAVDAGGGSSKGLKNARLLVAGGNNGQSELTSRRTCEMSGEAGVMLDFGREIHGGVQIVTSAAGRHGPVRVRVRLGESVSEAMSVEGEKGATNDHAMRDYTIELPWLGVVEVGNSGFRFARIDLLDTAAMVGIKEINAIMVYRDMPWRGSFRSSDGRLDSIWETGAYTVQLNMQQFLWDGIKRDRLVWLGDMHPEVMTVSAVFGAQEVVRRSLDLARDITPLPGWMNNMFAYSLWWVIIHRDWYLYHGDLGYLVEQKDYLERLLEILLSKVDSSGRLDPGEGGFLDWPSSSNPEGVKAGMHALMCLALEAGEELCGYLDSPGIASRCRERVEKMRGIRPDHNGLKSAAALMALSGIMDPVRADREVISPGGVEGFSTFYGYYMLRAQAEGGNYSGALDNIRRFWGAMLDLGATTFWEDFNMDWTLGAGRIDELPEKGKKDIHADYGAYCYVGLRHSLCHGWASGPTAWLSRYVLGVRVIEPGCRVIRIEPHLGDLLWVEGAFPTPLGDVIIRHEALLDGSISTSVKAPEGITVIK